MFGIGKILGIVRSIAPFLQFIPALAPFVTLFKIADQVSNLVKNFKNGFSFLDLVSKFAPMPKIFGQNALGSCFGLDSSKIGSWQNLFDSSSKEFKAFDLVKESVNDWNHIKSVRSNALYSGSFINA